MELQTKFFLLRLGFLSLYFSPSGPYKLNGYEFPVYKTKRCPRNETEWIQRSSAINCTKSNSYICIPNENFTELLEFCYIYPTIWINKDVCLYLIKRYSRVDSYNCSKFEFGCPNQTYDARQLIHYPSCTSIGNGCFRAESICQSGLLNMWYFSSSITTSVPIYNVHIKERGDLGWIVILYGAIFIFCVLIISYIFNLETNTPRENAIFKQWQQEDKRFITTKACREVENEIKNHNLVIVTGNTGYGKSAILQHIALKYREQGSIVKPISSLKEILDVCLSGKFSKKGILFVLNDPIGKIVVENKHYSRIDEEAITNCMKTIKILMSCRTYVLKDERVEEIFKENAVIVNINDDKCKLTKEEKRQIWNVHTSNMKLPEKDFSEIAETEAYFPLLCKMYSRNIKDVVLYFKKPIKYTENEIRAFRLKDKKKYCALILLVYFNNELRIDELIKNKISENKFKHALKVCGLHKNTSPHIIKDNLEYLMGVFVKKEGGAYKFGSYFVMEITSFVFGTDFPEETITYADIGFLQRRVKLENCTNPNDKLAIYLSDMNIDVLVKRLFAELFEERFLEAILHPCLRNERLEEHLQKELEQHPEKLFTLIEKKRPKIGDVELDGLSEYVWSKLSLISFEEEISPLFALIVFCINNFSSYCLKTLIQNNINLKGTCLFSAVCCNGSEKLFSMFSDAQIKELITENWENLYPIHIVSLFHNSEILLQLIESGANVNLNAKNEEAWTPLMFAVTQDNMEIEDNSCSQEFSSSMRRYQTLQILIKKGADVNSRTRDGASPLFSACYNGHNDIVELLLKEGADINSITDEDEISSLIIACEYGHDSIVQKLIDYGADVNLCTSSGVSPLFKACQRGFNSTVEILLCHGAIVNRCKKSGASPLYIACQNDHYSTVKLLLRNAADINLCRNDKTSPLFISCQCGNKKLVQLLLDNRADINLCDEVGTSPIFIACQKGHHDIVQFLLTRGANINACTLDGFSPLFIACQNGHEETVRTLLEYGANINERTKKGTSPENIALQNGHENIVQLFKRTKMYM